MRNVCIENIQFNDVLNTSARGDPVLSLFEHKEFNSGLFKHSQTI